MTVTCNFTDEGLAYMNKAALTGYSQISNWYVFPYTNNTLSVSSDSFATNLAALGEVTGYVNALRPTITWNSITNGTVSNSNTPIEFVISGSAATIYGYAVCSTATKSSSSGILLFTKKLATPVVSLPVGSHWVLTDGYTLVSA